MTPWSPCSAVLRAREASTISTFIRVLGSEMTKILLRKETIDLMKLTFALLEMVQSQQISKSKSRRRE